MCEINPSRPKTFTIGQSQLPLQASAPDLSADQSCQEWAEHYCNEILPQVSRTFALSICMLHGELQRVVLNAYLICRIADTIEDDSIASAESKIFLLNKLLECFESVSVADEYSKIASFLSGEPAHLHLVQHAHLVFAQFRTLPDQSQQQVHNLVCEMVQGMKKFINLYPQGIRIQTLDEYKEYCYYVAGTLGYFLTNLWYEYSSSIDAAKHQVLLKLCFSYSQALQTINILKDIGSDAKHENSIYIPQQLLKEQATSHQTLFSPEKLQQNQVTIKYFIEMTRTDLDKALEYLFLIPKSAVKIRLFCIFPILLACATLRELTQSSAMLEPGGSVKISRIEVKSLIFMGTISVLSNSCIRWLVAWIYRKPFIIPIFF